MTQQPPVDPPQQQVVHNNGSQFPWPMAIIAAVVTVLLVALMFAKPWEDDSVQTTPTGDTTPTTVVDPPDDTTPPDGGEDDGNGEPSGGPASRVARVIQAGSNTTVQTNQCVEGDIQVLLSSGWYTVYDDRLHTGHLTCFRSDHEVFADFESHVSGASVKEHEQQMLHQPGACYDGSNGCPFVHVIICEDGMIVSDYWVPSPPPADVT